MHSSTSRQTLPYSQAFEAIGTLWHIDTSDSLPPATIKAIHRHIEVFDRTYSRFRSDSLVARLAKEPGIYHFPDDADRLITFYRKLYNLTGGRVTPLIGAMLEKAGYDAAYSFRTKPQTALPDWDSTMTWSDNKVITHEPIVIDIGAAGKGYLVDKISTILDQADIEEYVVDGSGDILHKGAAEMIIGLEHPDDPSKVIGTIAIQNGSLCASASNRRIWSDGMHHIFDPLTMQPTQDIIATWVVAENTMIADGLATALFFADPQILSKEFKFDYVRMHHDRSVDYSPKFEGALFT